VFVNASCGLDRYRNVVAAYMTDLVPGLSRLATVQLAVTRELFAVRFVFVPLRVSPAPADYDAVRVARATFSATLFASGAVALNLTSAADPASLAGVANPAWLVGLRGDTALGQGDGLFADEWGGVPGVYPPRAALRSNTTIRFCPLSRELCVYPSLASVAGGDVVWLTGPFTVCFADEAFRAALRCRFGAELVGAAPVYSASLRALGCVTPPAAVPGAVLVGLEYAFDEATRVNVTLAPPLSVLFVAADDARLAAAPPLIDGFCAQCVNPLYALQYAACAPDCAGAPSGSATLDECGQCVGGRTNRTANAAKDCAGVCFGSSVLNGSECVCAGDACPQPPITASPPSERFDAWRVYHTLMASALALFFASMLALALAKRLRLLQPSRGSSAARSSSSGASVDLLLDEGEVVGLPAPRAQPMLQLRPRPPSAPPREAGEGGDEEGRREGSRPRRPAPPPGPPPPPQRAAAAASSELEPPTLGDEADDGEPAAPESPRLLRAQTSQPGPSDDASRV
jgi:hypothetical protein